MIKEALEALEALKKDGISLTRLLSIASDEEREVLIFKVAMALGFDAPRFFALVSMRASHDEDFGVQLVGRILRVHRRLQGRAAQNKLPDILKYGFVFLADLSAQTGLNGKLNYPELLKTFTGTTSRFEYMGE